MGENSGIEWTDHTFNPWWGCTKVSPACDHCYAESFANRVGYSAGGSRFPIWGKESQRRFFGDKHWAEPLKWNRAAEVQGVRKRVFCASMADVMEEYGGEESLVRETIMESRRWLYARISQTPHLDWLLLTKRPQNFRRLLPFEWACKVPENVWGMATVESQQYLWRAEELAKVPFAVRGLSMEPLLGEVDLSRVLPVIDWVIAGAESGRGARETDIEWVRSLKNQCVAAGVPFFYKQGAENGRAIPTPELDGTTWVQLPR